jgi:hypothetical protein
MKALRQHLSLLFSISLLFAACSSSHQKVNEIKEEKGLLGPSPIVSPETDSHKNNLDQEREKRRKK